MKFTKYQGLGNDYIILDPADGWKKITPAQVRGICDRHYGAGSDGILWGPLAGEALGAGLAADREGFYLRIFNPDGSVVEKSGNGLRIFARYLWDRQLVGVEPFHIQTLGGQVTARVHAGGGTVTVEMGQVSFDSQRIPIAGPRREVLRETLLVDGQELTCCAATIGNPHCVILLDEVSAEIAKKWGPLIETEARFPNRTNVQFIKVLDRNNLQLEIWERGAGYTLASGSSSCAAAACAHRLGLCDAHIYVHMPGGALEISIGDDYSITMTGEVGKVYQGVVSDQVPGIR